jgi:hypothetical protein
MIIVSINPGNACTDCGHFACVCAIRDAHDEGCLLRLAITCPVPIECEHGRDFCGRCDPCTCKGGVKP